MASSLKRGVILTIFILFNGILTSFATDYYIHPTIGSDQYPGTSSIAPFKTLEKVSNLSLAAGDKILLAAGETFKGMIFLDQIYGNEQAPITISSYGWGNTYEDARAIIDASHNDHGILLIDCAYIAIKNLIIQAPDSDGRSTEKMKCGVLFQTSRPGVYRDISISNLLIRDIFMEAKGFERGDKEVRTPNGVQRYGWGIRLINRTPGADIKDVSIKDCKVVNVGHTGIKLTSSGRHIQDVIIENNRILRTGGPGMQWSGGNYGVFRNNHVSYSGSKDDSRKWGRGSGMWVWGCSYILIEHNYFLHANGPGDSAGCHIDFNCHDVVVQYNFSAHNAGGFCEILGNNYNCAYRYNISVDDGHRIKGKDGAFQEGKTFWLSGYVGKNRKRNGPFNSYFYNNTIYVSKEIVSKIAVSKVAKGVLIANNIFYVEGNAKAVMGDQYVPEEEGIARINNIFFQNNLYLQADYWPKEVWIKDSKKIIGDADLQNPGGMNPVDYIPHNKELVVDKGILIPHLKGDSIGLKIGLLSQYDILGNPVIGVPDLGAIEWSIGGAKQ